MSEARNEVEQLKQNIKRAEEIDKLRDEVADLDMELLWAIVSDKCVTILIQHNVKYILFNIGHKGGKKITKS